MSRHRAGQCVCSVGSDYGTFISAAFDLLLNWIEASRCGNHGAAPVSFNDNKAQSSSFRPFLRCSHPGSSSPCILTQQLGWYLTFSNVRLLADVVLLGSSAVTAMTADIKMHQCTIASPSFCFKLRQISSLVVVLAEAALLNKCFPYLSGCTAIVGKTQNWITLA